MFKGYLITSLVILWIKWLPGDVTFMFRKPLVLSAMEITECHFFVWQLSFISINLLPTEAPQTVSLSLHKNDLWHTEIRKVIDFNHFTNNEFRNILFIYSFIDVLDEIFFTRRNKIKTQSMIFGNYEIEWPSNCFHVLGDCNFSVHFHSRIFY